MATSAKALARIGKSNQLGPDWTEDYAEWLAVQPRLPSKLEKQAKASLLSGSRKPFVEIQQLEKTQAFQAMVQASIQRQMADAKATLRAATPEFLEGHLKMFRQSLKADDYVNSIKYTQPIVDRVWAKAEEGKAPAAEIHLHFGETGFAAKYQEPLNTEYEVIVEPPEVAG